MSVWTHVAGVIRVDHIKWDENDKELDFNKLIGKELRFTDSEEKWLDSEKHPEKYLPMGSEGSLRMSVWTNPEIRHMARYVVTIWGDLRDYDTPNKIIEWFKEKCKNLNVLNVRNAVITAECEYGKTLTWTYKEED